MSLRPLPEHERIVSFEAEQRGTDAAYHVEMAFQYAGGPRYAVDIPVGAAPFDLRFMVERADAGGEDWPYCGDDEPLYAGGDLTLADIARDLRDFVENNFHVREG